MPSPVTDPILDLLQEQLECCRNLEAATARVLELLQSGETAAALNVLDDRQPVTLQMQGLENRINELHARENAPAAPKQPRRFLTAAESIGASIKRQLELEDHIAEALGRLAEDEGKAMGELAEGGKLVSSYFEGLAEGSGVDLVVT